MPLKKTGLVILALLASAGAFAWYEFASKPTSVRPRSAGAPVTVRTPTKPADDSLDRLSQAASNAIPVSVKSEETTSTESTSGVIEAFTEPYHDIAVAASEMGPLSEIKVHEGDRVKAGDIIAMMDDDVLRASLEVARRSMNVEGVVKSAQADLAMKRVEKEKLIQLRDRNHASQQEVDRIETDLIVSEARLLSVREDLEVKQLEFRRIEAQLEQRVVRAPMDGVITEVVREPGEYVSPSDPTIARLVQLDPLLIVFSVPLDKRNEVARNQTVKLKIGASQSDVKGLVEYVSPTPDPSNSSVRVKVQIPNPDQRFQSGEQAILVLDSATEPSTSPAPTESTPVADGNHETAERR